MKLTGAPRRRPSKTLLSARQGGLMDECKEQRERFEAWVVKQFPGQFPSDVLTKDEEGAYEDLHVSVMFLGFCAGWKSGR